MFDPKSTEAFRQIKAPEGLKERVLRKSHRKTFRFTPAMGGLVAAALVLVFLSVGIFHSPTVGVTVGGLTVEEQTVSWPMSSINPMSRTVEPLSQEVVFDREVTLTSADGLVTDGDYLPLEFPCTIKADTPIWWHVQPTQETFLMTADAKGQTVQLCLTYDEFEKLWSIRRMTAE